METSCHCATSMTTEIIFYWKPPRLTSFTCLPRGSLSSELNQKPSFCQKMCSLSFSPLIKIRPKFFLVCSSWEMKCTCPGFHRLVLGSRDSCWRQWLWIQTVHRVSLTLEPPFRLCTPSSVDIKIPGCRHCVGSVPLKHGAVTIYSSLLLIVFLSFLSNSPVDLFSLGLCFPCSYFALSLSLQ